MPYAILTVGLIALIAAINNKQGELAELVKKDFSGNGNFFFWLAAIGIVGGAGYIEPLRVPSRMLIGLILMVMILSNKGLYQKFTEALHGVQTPAPATSQNVGAAQSNPRAETPAPASAAPSTVRVPDPLSLIPGMDLFFPPRPNAAGQR